MPDVPIIGQPTPEQLRARDFFMARLNFLVASVENLKICAISMNKSGLMRFVDKETSSLLQNELIECAALCSVPVEDPKPQ